MVVVGGTFATTTSQLIIMSDVRNKERGGHIERRGRTNKYEVNT